MQVMMAGSAFSFGNEQQQCLNPNLNLNNPKPASKKRRNLPGTPDPDAEVIALSPKTLMATNRFVCEICSKGFQRDQNLQLHRRGHNLPWKLKQRANKDVPVRKKVYVCPEKSCVHHEASRALGDLTGIKKHFSRKHGEKKWKCERCSKKYAVQSDWKAHVKTCGTREYKCDCGTLFSRKDTFITHRAFCDALFELERQAPDMSSGLPNYPRVQQFTDMSDQFGLEQLNASNLDPLDAQGSLFASSSMSNYEANSTSKTPMPATALLQKAAQIGSSMSRNTSIFVQAMTSSSSSSSPPSHLIHQEPTFPMTPTAGFTAFPPSRNNGFNHNRTMMQIENPRFNQMGLTRDFMGISDDGHNLGRPFLPHELEMFASMS